VFGGMIDGPTWNADEASDRRIVHESRHSLACASGAIRTSYRATRSGD
jgi:hypothetical protein